MFNVEVPFENGKFEIIFVNADENEQMNEDREDNEHEHEHGPLLYFFSCTRVISNKYDNIIADECPFFFYLFNI